MLKIAILGLLFFVVVATFLKPWVGAVVYVALAVLSPQYIWFWGMEGIRASMVMAIVTCLSLALHLAMGDVSLSPLKTRQNYLMLLLWVLIALSYVFGALPPNNLGNLNLNSAELLERYNKVFIMYFLMQPLIDDIKKLNYVVWALILVFAFFTYWANEQYLSGEMFVRGVRLSGPMTPSGAGNYTDENVFAMLFVMAVPLFYFVGNGCGNKVVRLLLFLLIPFAWHSVFLTGSRGGLVGLAIISLHMLYRSRTKVLGVLLAVGLVAAFVYQGGAVMKERSDTIVEYQEDPSAMSRLEAWTMASSMIADHPVFGVGLGNFTVAWKSYADTRPRVAHSTILQFAAEDGILSGIVFAILFLTAATDLKKLKSFARQGLRTVDERQARKIVSIGNALEGACLGYFICGLFLNLGSFEVIYVFIMIITLLRTHVDGINDGLAKQAVRASS